MIKKRSKEPRLICPKDSKEAWSSAKSLPLKKLCLESQPARSAAESSMPKPQSGLKTDQKPMKT